MQDNPTILQPEQRDVQTTQNATQDAPPVSQTQGDPPLSQSQAPQSQAPQAQAKGKGKVKQPAKGKQGQNAKGGKKRKLGEVSGSK